MRESNQLQEETIKRYYERLWELSLHQEIQTIKRYYERVNGNKIIPRVCDNNKRV